MSGFEDVRSEDTPDIETLVIWRLFFVPRVNFWVNSGQKMTKFKLFKCSYLPYNFPSSSVKILRFYFHFWLDLDRVSSTYIRMDPNVRVDFGIILDFLWTAKSKQLIENVVFTHFRLQQKNTILVLWAIEILFNFVKIHNIQILALKRRRPLKNKKFENFSAWNLKNWVCWSKTCHKGV